jgi:hypothetical protein
MAGLIIFFLIYFGILLAGMAGIWFLISRYDAIIFRKTKKVADQNA